MKFYDLCLILDEIESKSSRIEIRNIISKSLSKVDKDSLDKVIYILQSEIFRPYEGLELNIGKSIVEDAIRKAYGFEKEDISKSYKTTGDLGLSAFEMSKKRLQRSILKKELSIDYLYSKLKELVLQTGKDSIEKKIKTLSALFQDSSDIEAKYLAKIIMQTLRISLGNQTLIESAVIFQLEKEGIKDYKDNMERFNYIKAKIEEKYNICYDLGLTLKYLLYEGIESLSNIKINIGIPIKSALCERENDANSIINRIGKCNVEEKYDGFRIQIHHNENFTKIFSRRGENITNMFPEIINNLKEFQVSFIIDAEAIGFDQYENKYLNFQDTIKRKRKHNIDKALKDIPIVANAFDIMLINNEELINEPFHKRRRILEDLINNLKSEIIRTSKYIVAENEDEIIKFMNKCLDEGLEGIIAKDLNKPYVPGLRDFAWIKLKKNYMKDNIDTYDLVVIGYNKGKGKNANLPSRLICAVYNKDSDNYIAITGLGSGIDEDNLKLLNEELNKISIDSKLNNYELKDYDVDNFVLPKFVIEVIADEVTKTNDGYSLRFPRFVKIREDKAPTDTTTIEELKRIYSITHKN